MMTRSRTCTKLIGSTALGPRSVGSAPVTFAPLSKLHLLPGNDLHQNVRTPLRCWKGISEMKSLCYLLSHLRGAMHVCSVGHFVVLCLIHVSPLYRILRIAG